MTLTFKTIVSIALITFLNSCGTSKSTDNTSSSQGDVTEMKNKGYSEGTLTTNKDSGCPVILNVSEIKDNLDPINLSDFMKGELPQKVWVKYSSMRMANRCDNARPVSITEMVTR